VNDLKPSEHAGVRHQSKRKARKSPVTSDSSDCDTPVEEEREWCDPNPTQNDEWLDYLQRSMEEVMAGDLSCLLKPPLVAVATAPLSRRNASPKVIEYVACLLSIPFAIEDITSDNVTTLFDTYLESKIVDLILQGTKTLVTDRTTEEVCHFYFISVIVHK
jgi:fused-like protein